jgi:hypothetical protein
MLGLILAYQNSKKKNKTAPLLHLDWTAGALCRAVNKLDTEKSIPLALGVFFFFQCQASAQPWLLGLYPSSRGILGILVPIW